MSLSAKTADLLQLFEFKGKKIAVGLSGGADSLYLTLVLQECMRKAGGELVALTVDHGLRNGSDAEALAVAREMKKRKIKHEILTWTGEKPVTKIEEKAREARYQLLTKYCISKQIDVLFLAHHLQDQVETFYARLSKGSSPAGLAAMAPVSFRNGIRIVRPLLEVSKNDIIGYLKKKKIKWVEDPMNSDDAYERVRWRQKMPVLEKMGLGSEKVALSIKRLRRSEEAIRFYEEAFFNAHVRIDPMGYAFIPQKEFQAAAMEIRVRALIHAVQIIGKCAKPVSLGALEGILMGERKSATLSGCHIIFHKARIFIARESARMEKKKKLPAGKHVWDRFDIESSVPFTI
ncbi:MAG: tRNA lysidine(34) synthetase TilS [Lactobacillales bacterium]|jgi:tRNA(Ile)-lysidine synthase|nr:tRNA lysidine(34) synthetase TilS [Lactobacillales bacterium]